MNQSKIFVGQHLFSQVLQLSSKERLQGVFAEHKANRYYKSLHAWDHYVSMLFCVLGNCTSLREISYGLACYEGKLNHVGVRSAPAKSTLSDANKKRSSKVFEAIYQKLIGDHRLVLSDSTLPKYVVKQLFVIDSTVFSLFKEILKTAGRSGADGKRKGGIKKNTVLSGSSLMPQLVRFTAAADHDLRLLAHVQVPQGSYLVFDKGYTDYERFADYSKQGIFFITRQKENAVYRSAYELDIPRNAPNALLKDEIIEQPYKDASGGQHNLRLRRIAWWDASQQRTYEFITNNEHLPAKTIAAIYRYRWKIELFFKKLKQNFPLQYFVGDNQNAIEIQIWCALIALLLLQVLHAKHQCKLAFSNLVAIVRLHLYNYNSIAKIIRIYSRRSKRRAVVHTELTLFNSV